MCAATLSRGAIPWVVVPLAGRRTLCGATPQKDRMLAGAVDEDVLDVALGDECRGIAPAFAVTFHDRHSAGEDRAAPLPGRSTTPRTVRPQ